MPSFISGLPAPPRAPAGQENQLTLLLSGTPGSGKRTFAQALQVTGKQTAGGPLLIRTRETLLQTPAGSSPTSASSADFLLLLVDSTSSTALDELETTLSVLPTGWWTYTAILVTKVDQRTRRAADLLDVAALRKRYDPSLPVFYSSPLTLAATAARVHQLVDTSSTGTTNLKSLRQELVLSYGKDDEGPGGMASAM